MSEGKARRGTKRTTVVQWADGSVTIHQDTNYIVLGKEIVRGLYDDLTEFYQSSDTTTNPPKEEIRSPSTPGDKVPGKSGFAGSPKSSGKEVRGSETSTRDENV